MNIEEINQILNKALRRVIKRDQHLLKNEINEPAISHKLAVYLEGKFIDFDIDCEYNGYVDADNGRKYLSILRDRARELGIVEESANESGLVNRYVYPDIIVHKRGQNGGDNNLLVIEVKKSSNPNGWDWDAEKLKRFTSTDNDNNFSYQYGVFIIFNVGQDLDPSFSIYWYQNGRCLDLATVNFN